MPRYEGRIPMYEVWKLGTLRVRILGPLAWGSDEGQGCALHEERPAGVGEDCPYGQNEERLRRKRRTPAGRRW